MDQAEAQSEVQVDRPKSVSFVGIAWILDGIVLLLCTWFLAGIFLFSIPRPHDIRTVPLFFVSVFCGPGLLAAIGYRLIYNGDRTWQGRASSITPNGIGSLVLGLAILTPVIWAVVSRAKPIPSALTFVVYLVLASPFVGPGILALLCRKKYAAWRIAKRSQAAANEGPTKFNEKQGFCSACNQEVLIRRRKPNHARHFFMSLLLGGLWLPVWYARYFYGPPWKCSACGRTIRPVFSWKGFFEGILPALGLVALIAFVTLFWTRVISTPATPLRIFPRGLGPPERPLTRSWFRARIAASSAGFSLFVQRWSRYGKGQGMWKKTDGLTRVEAVVLGALCALFSLLVLLGILNTPWNRRSRHLRVHCKNNLHQIGTACYLYTDMNGGFWPAHWDGQRFDPMMSLALLYPDYMDSSETFGCPRTEDKPLITLKYLNGTELKSFGPVGGENKCSYFYDPVSHWRYGASLQAVAADADGMTWRTPEGKKPAYPENWQRKPRKPNHENGQNVMYIDGSVRWSETNYAGYDPMDNIFCPNDGWDADTDAYLWDGVNARDPEPEAEVTRGIAAPVSEPD